MPVPSAKKQPQNVRMLIGKFIYILFYVFFWERSNFASLTKRELSLPPKSNKKRPSPKIMQISSDNLKLQTINRTPWIHTHTH